MKNLHRSNLFCWSEFNDDRNIDFNSYLWVREAGNVVIDPLPLSDHDEKHLHSFGKVTHILITNSDHVRNGKNFAMQTGAEIWGPEGEKDTFPILCTHWLSDGNKPVLGLTVYTMHGSKTPGELAIVLDGNTLITGDLIRAHEGGKLGLLPDKKLRDKKAAMASVKRLAGIGTIEAVLPGDGWPVFRDGQRVLTELVDAFPK
ncbi:MAG: MBL fold metallo-hydrolase [Candidatus Marinimicrobia bacterium]|nr:MBL fold metallo-hydrolase [Candidatus Neomarinimicrobiota bacterium]